MNLARKLLIGSVWIASLLGVGESAWAQRIAAREGDKAYREKRFDEAEKAYNDALREQPERSGPLLYNRGNSAYRNRRYEDAEKAFRQALEHPLHTEQQADAWYNLGNALLQQGKTREAIQAYTESIKRKPAAKDAKTNLQLARNLLEKQNKGSSNPEQNPEREPQDEQQDAENQGEPKEQQAPQAQQQAQDKSQQTPDKGRDELLQIMKALEREDQKTMKKYREREQKNTQTKAGKDW